MELRKVHSEYLHIDNGGITIDFAIEEHDDSNFIPVIEFNTQYFGYASLSSKLQGIELTAEYLRDIGDAFHKFADSVSRRQLEASMQDC